MWLLRKVRSLIFRLQFHCKNNLYTFRVALNKGLVNSTDKEKEFQIIKLNFPDDGTNYFNPTMQPFGDGFGVILRAVGRDHLRGLRKCFINDKSEKISNFKELKLGVFKDSREINWCADPRIFIFKHRIFVSYNTGHIENPNQIYIQELDQDLNPISDPIKLQKKDGRRNIEKNWGFFEYNNKLFAIYSVSPFVVVSIEFDENKEIAEAYEYVKYTWSSNDIEKRYGQLRGGASPIMIDNKMYYVIQSNIKSSIGCIYTGTIMTFDAFPPFKPKEIAIRPIFKLTPEEYHKTPIQKLNKKVEACLYPTGSYYDSTSASLYISYGINDSYCAIRRYSKEVIDMYISPLKCYRS